MGSCLTNCQDITLVANPTAGCTPVGPRYKNISRLLFMLCNIDLPNPLTIDNIAPLFADGSIVMTSELANIVVADRTTEDVPISDCRPALKQDTGRVITAEDRIALQTAVGSPVVTNLFADYNFWKDKVLNQFQLIAAIVYCDGDVVIPKYANGQYIPFTLEAQLAYQKSSVQGGKGVEFKKLSIAFAADPLFFQVPDVNILSLF